jgi:hypothetical protein
MSDVRSAIFITHLDLILDRSLRTRGCIDTLASHLAARKETTRRSIERWVLAKRALLAALFALSFMQYYMLGVRLEIMSLRPIAFVVGV